MARRAWSPIHGCAAAAPFPPRPGAGLRRRHACRPGAAMPRAPMARCISTRPAPRTARRWCCCTRPRCPRASSSPSIRGSPPAASARSASTCPASVSRIPRRSCPASRTTRRRSPPCSTRSASRRRASSATTPARWSRPRSRCSSPARIDRLLLNGPLPLEEAERAQWLEYCRNEEIPFREQRGRLAFREAVPGPLRFRARLGAGRHRDPLHRRDALGPRRRSGTATTPRSSTIMRRRCVASRTRR